MRLIAKKADVDRISASVRRVEGVESIEEVDDLVPQLGHAHRPTMLRSLDVRVSESTALDRVRRAAEAAAARCGITAEFLEE